MINSIKQQHNKLAQCYTRTETAKLENTPFWPYIAYAETKLLKPHFSPKHDRERESVNSLQQTFSLLSLCFSRALDSNLNICLMFCVTKANNTEEQLWKITLYPCNLDMRYQNIQPARVCLHVCFEGFTVE